VSSNCTVPSTDPGCLAQSGVKQYQVVKTASTSKIKLGGTVGYTITVTNTGQVSYPASDPAIVMDHMTGLLDDAAYNHDARATGGRLSYRAPTLSWKGALPVGGTVTIRYSVTVERPDGGDGRLANVVVTPQQPGGVRAGNCPTVGAGPNCSTSTRVEGEQVSSGGGGGLPFTGDFTRIELILAAALLELGGAMLWLAAVRRRRRPAF
jgi:hypothetical protein